MKLTNRYLGLPGVLLLGVLLLASCGKDGGPTDPDPENPDRPPGTTIDPDKLSEYLVLTDATKKTGNLPTAPDGQIKMEVEDIIYVVKGYPIGHRINVWHNSSQDVSGYYIYLGGASFYYDVPEEIVEGQYVPAGESDTLSTLVLDIDLPSDEKVNYPYTVEIKIQPHDPGGVPLDEFSRKITVEDPDGSACNSILRTATDHRIWEWDFTIWEFTGEVFAPGLAKPINSQGAGCCRDDGVSVTTSDSPSCFKGTPNPRFTWVELELDDYLLRTWELLWLWDYGTAVVAGEEEKKQYNRSITNFCAGTAGYDFDSNSYGDASDTSTHSFAPGDEHIFFNFPNWFGGYHFPDEVDIIYTCHTLIMSWGGQENGFSSVYKEMDFFNGTFDFKKEFKPWFD